MEKLPFEDKAFDLAFMGHVLHEADDLLTALKEAQRVASCASSCWNGRTKPRSLARRWNIA